MSVKISIVLLAALAFALDANAIIGRRVQGHKADRTLISEGGAAEQKAKAAMKPPMKGGAGKSVPRQFATAPKSPLKAF